MEVSLKPCPFCGSKARIREWERDRRIKNPIINYYIECQSWLYVNGCPAKTKLYDDKEKAIQAWNTRAQAHPSITDCVEEVKRLRDKYVESTSGLVFVPSNTFEEIISALESLQNKPVAENSPYVCAKCGRSDEHMAECSTPSYCPGCGSRVIGHDWNVCIRKNRVE